jgi:hypothetical protein
VRDPVDAEVPGGAPVGVPAPINAIRAEKRRGNAFLDTISVYRRELAPA